MGLVDDIRNDVKKSGSNKGKLLYLKSGTKVRIRFLQEFSEGSKILWHDSFDAGVNHPCQELFDRECTYHDGEGFRHGNMYAWSVYDYESKEVKILIGRVNNCSPIPLLMGFYDSYGTIMDRDYVITQNGSGTTKSFSIVPQDKAKFKNKKVKPFSESKLLSVLDKAYPVEDAEDEEDEKPRRSKNKKSSKKTKTKRYEEPEDDDDEDFEDDEDELDDDEDEVDYEEMTAKELYRLCKERGASVKPQKSESYYIRKLEELDDLESEDGEDEEDEWDE